MKNARKKTPLVSAETIARRADRGEDVSRFFTNRGRMNSIALELDGVAMETRKDGPITTYLLVDRESTHVFGAGAASLDDIDGLIEIATKAVANVRAAHGPFVPIKIVHDGASLYCDASFIAALESIGVGVASDLDANLTSTVERAEWDMRQHMARR